MNKNDPKNRLEKPNQESQRQSLIKVQNECYLVFSFTHMQWATEELANSLCVIMVCAYLCIVIKMLSL